MRSRYSRSRPFDADANLWPAEEGSGIEGTAVDWTVALSMSGRLLGCLSARAADRIRARGERAHDGAADLPACGVLQRGLFDPGASSVRHGSERPGESARGAGHRNRVHRRRGDPEAAQRDSVHGTATAASVWTTGAIGAAMAYGEYVMAVLLSAVTYATFRWMTPLKEAVEKRADLDGSER